MTTDIDRELERLALPEHIAAWTRNAFDWWAAEQKGHAGERVRALKSELAAAERGRERLMDLVVSGILREDDFRRRRDDAETRIAELRLAIQEPEAELDAFGARLEEALTAGSRIGDIIKGRDPEARRAFLAQVCANLVVTDRITKLSLRFPFTLLESAADVSNVVPKLCANLPPETVLHERKSARPRIPRERALLTWWTKVEEVRTGEQPLAEQRGHCTIASI